MAELITRSLVHGFALYTVIGLFIHRFPAKGNKQEMERFDYSACQIGALAGFIYLVLSAIDTLSLGRYSIPVWIQLLMLLSVQLLWFGKLYTIKWLRVLIALMLILSIEGWVLIPSEYRNYLGGTWNLPFLAQLRNWIFDLILLSVVSAAFYWLKSYFRR